MRKIDTVRKALAKMTLKTPDKMLNIMIKSSLSRQNSNPQEAEEVANRMLNATRTTDGKVDIRYTLLCIGKVGKYLLSNTAEGHIRYLNKRKNADEVEKLKVAMDAYEGSVVSGVPINEDTPVLVKISMSKAVFLGLYHNIVDAQTAWYHGEIVTEGTNWFFHSIVLLNTFEIFRKTLGLPVPEEIQDQANGEEGDERERIARV